MTLAIKLGRLSSQLFKNKVYLYSATRYYSDTPLPWNYIWKPGEYSEKEHDKIAEKYHLHPKDYKPYPDNERFMADYPALPQIGPAAKDPYYPYDMPAYKRNYHETLHDQFEIMGEDRFSYGYNYRYDLAWATAICITVFFALAGLYALLLPYPSVHPVMEKQYPRKGEVHYTFEPER